MIGERRVLAVIPARGGSKGLPGKNILPVNGRPLLAWTVDAARASRHIDRYILSSDDPAIIDAARSLGCEAPFQRPAALATDTATSIDVVLHALDAVGGYDVVVLLQPTSPLRTAEDIDAACERFAASGAPSCVTVCEAQQSPYWMYRVGESAVLEPFAAVPPGVTRRQDLPRVYALNGAVYVADATWLRASRSFLGPQTVAQVMPIERSIDIDTPADFKAFRSAVIEDNHA